MLDSFFVAYPHLQTALNIEPPNNALGQGEPMRDMKAKLERMDRATLLDGQRVQDEELADGCLSGLWLAYNFLDESHRISQEIETLEGSYWHGIMHRREPDYGNAKYWFARVPRHPVYDELARLAPKLFAQQPTGDPHAAFLQHEQAWSAPTFVDLCAAIARGKADCEKLALAVAQAEWRLLFDFCYEGACGHK